MKVPPKLHGVTNQKTPFCILQFSTVCVIN